MEIARYIPLNNGGNLIAYVDLKIPGWGMQINGCKLMRSSNGHQFIAMPSKPYEKDGETKYTPYVWFDKDVQQRFQKAALDAIGEYAKSHHGEQPHGTGSDEPPF